MSLFAHIDIAASYAVLIGILAGALAGFVHFTTLRRNTAYFAGGLFGKAFALQSARFAVLVIVLALTARLGWQALVAATVSLTLVRMLIVRRERGRMTAFVGDAGDSLFSPRGEDARRADEGADAGVAPPHRLAALGTSPRGEKRELAALAEQILTGDRPGQDAQ